MDCKEEIVDVRIPHPEEFEKGKALMQNVFKLNQTMPYTEEYFKILKEVFGDNLGENSIVNAPIQGACIDRIKIGKNVFINSNTLFMARGVRIRKETLMNYILNNTEGISKNRRTFSLGVFFVFILSKIIILKTSILYACFGVVVI